MFRRLVRCTRTPSCGVSIAALAPATLWLSACTTAQPEAARPLRALLITGGGFHNYPFQAIALTNAVGRLTPVQWTVVNEGGGGTKAQIPLYDNPDWARGYDVVVHNECFADTTDTNYIRKIIAASQAGA